METAAQRFTQLLIRKGVLYEHDQELYSYCFELLLSTVVNFAVLLAAALFTGSLLETMFFLVGFLSLRAVAGGYHAGTHLRCLLLLMLFYAVFLIVIKLIPADGFRWILLGGSLFSLCTVFTLAPIGHKNKPVSQMELKRYEQRSKLVESTLLLIIALALFIRIDWMNSVCLCSLALGMCAISISLIMAKVQNHRKERSGRNEGLVG